MIGQNSNNKATGYTAKECDAGIPISGRTSDTGTYEILKVNADGSIATQSAMPPAIGYLGTNAVAIVLPAFAPPANTYLGSVQLNGGNLIAAGLYRINPTFTWSGAAGGGVSFILANNSQIMGGYIASLPPLNAFAPTIGDLQNGFYGYWHNTATQILGGNMMITYNRSQSLDVYLDAGFYTMALVTDGAFVSNGPGGFFGFYEFTKLG